MSNKQIVTDLLAQLPDEITLEEILDELSIIAAVQRSERQITVGNWISHEDIKTRPRHGLRNKVVAPVRT